MHELQLHCTPHAQVFAEQLAFSGNVHAQVDSMHDDGAMGDVVSVNMVSLSGVDVDAVKT